MYILVFNHAKLFNYHWILIMDFYGTQLKQSFFFVVDSQQVLLNVNNGQPQILSFRNSYFNQLLFYIELPYVIVLDYKIKTVYK